MKKVEINYNPYKMITTVLIDGVDVCKDGHYDKFREFIKNEMNWGKETAKEGR